MGSMPFGARLAVAKLVGAKLIGTGLAAGAAMLAAGPVAAQLNNEPYSYRSGGGVGMSNAYRQAYLDQEITGSRPRNLLRGADGSLLTVTERDGQAVVTTRPSNYVLYRGGNVAGVSVAGAGYAFGLGSPIDSWTGSGVALTPPGGGRSPVDSWVAQLDGLRPVE